MAFAAPSLAADFSVSAEAPPDGLAVLGVPALEDAPLSLAGASALPDELSLLLPVVLVDVVDVDVVCAAADSALVFVGGVISGVLLGTASDTLLPPQALTPNPPSNAATAASATRALTAAPCACRTWGSR